jgi:hypothetical protein
MTILKRVLQKEEVECELDSSVSELSPVEAASKHGNESSDIHGSLVIA